MFESRHPARTPESIPRHREFPVARARLAVFCFAILLSGCAGRQNRPPAEPVSIPTPVAGAAFLPTASKPVQPTAVPSPSPNLRPSRPLPVPRSAAAAVSDKLNTSFDVVQDTPDSLRVSKKNSPPAPSPSLFEESILLGKIRGALSPAASRGSRPATFSRGVASVSIPSATAPGTAALAIAKILALDGVNEVRAEFPSQ